jgi:heme exporter protein A
MKKPFPLDPRQICVNKLSCTRGERPVFNDISFAASAGTATLLRGPNGAGKSSLLMCLAGLLDYAGEISVQGRDDEQYENADIHFVSHLSALKPNLTVSENLTFWAHLNQGDPQNIPAALIAARLGHAANLATSDLSAGQIHRLSLLRLLVAQRPIWLLDEPTSALDSQGEKWIGARIDAHLALGGIAIIATHLDIPLEAKPATIAISKTGETEVSL